MYDAEVGATYSYNEGSGMLVSYDTVDMAMRKVDYMRKMGLGGAMWWEISGDKVGAGSIVSNVSKDLRWGRGRERIWCANEGQVVKKMGGANGADIESSPNWLLYPDSRYDNIKAGFSAQAQTQTLRRR
jgi:chitinase